MTVSARSASRRWPWLLAAVLLLGSAGSAAASTYLFWLPCRGTMLDGSIFSRFDVALSFSDACLQQMDSGTPFPYPPALGPQQWWSATLAAAAIALAALSWVPVMVGCGWQGRSRAAATVPVAATLLLAAATSPAARGLDLDDSGWAAVCLWLVGEIAGLVAVLVIAREESASAPALLVKLVVLGWGATAFGMVHQTGDYLSMVMTSSANWDVPPGTGYGTSLVLVVVAAALAVLAARSQGGSEVAESSTGSRDPSRLEGP